jgi:hypothetical protein
MVRVKAEIQHRTDYTHHEILNIWVNYLPQPVIFNVEHGKKPPLRYHQPVQEPIYISKEQTNLACNIIKLIFDQSGILQSSPDINIKCKLEPLNVGLTEINFELNIDRSIGSFAAFSSQKRINNKELMKEVFITDSFGIVLDPDDPYRISNKSSSILTRTSLKKDPTRPPYLSKINVIRFKYNNELTDSIDLEIEDQPFLDLLKQEIEWRPSETLPEDHEAY